MRKKIAHRHDGKSLKTLLIYTSLVIFLIVLSLAWKALLLYQQSKYTGDHFVLALTNNNIVKEVLVFHPADESMMIMQLVDSNIKFPELIQKASLYTDGYINSNDNMQINHNDISSTLTTLLFRYPSITTDLTLIDLGRLALYAKNLPPNKMQLKEITKDQLLNDPQQRKLLAAFFSDNVIATENVSIQIINASGVSGMAQRLERVLLNKGANVVTVTTAQKHENLSRIQYYGDETYTLQKVKKLLGFPARIMDKKTLADIVIILGKDSSNTSAF